MRSQIVRASPFLTISSLPTLWSHDLPCALRKQVVCVWDATACLKTYLKKLAKGRERKELPPQLGLISGIMSVDVHGCPRCENQLCFGGEVDLFLFCCRFARGFGSPPPPRSPRLRPCP